MLYSSTPLSTLINSPLISIIVVVIFTIILVLTSNWLYKKILTDNGKHLIINAFFLIKSIIVTWVLNNIILGIYPSDLKAVLLDYKLQDIFWIMTGLVILITLEFIRKLLVKFAQNSISKYKKLPLLIYDNLLNLIIIVVVVLATPIIYYRIFPVTKTVDNLQPFNSGIYPL